MYVKHFKNHYIVIIILLDTSALYYFYVISNIDYSKSEKKPPILIF